MSITMKSIEHGIFQGPLHLTRGPRELSGGRQARRQGAQHLPDPEKHKQRRTRRNPTRPVLRTAPSHSGLLL